MTVLKNDGPPLYYKRKVFENEDPAFVGSFAVDFVSTPNSEKDETLPIRTTYFSEEEFNEIGSNDSRPMLVVLHGLSGGSYEIYLKHVIAPLVGAKGEKQWEACVINSRGCAMSKITSSILFNARATWDIRHMIVWLRKTFPNRPLFGIGLVFIYELILFSSLKAGNLLQTIDTPCWVVGARAMSSWLCNFEGALC